MFGTHCDTNGCRGVPVLRVVTTFAHPSSRHRGETIVTDKERCAACCEVYVEDNRYHRGTDDVLVLNVYPIGERTWTTTS